MSSMSMNEEIKILLVNESDYSLGRTVFCLHLLNHFMGLEYHNVLFKATLQQTLFLLPFHTK